MKRIIGIVLLLVLFILLPSGWKIEDEKEVVRVVYEYDLSSGQPKRKTNTLSEEKKKVPIRVKDEKYYSERYNPEYYDLLWNFKYIQLSSKERAAYIQLSRGINKHMKVIVLDETISFDSLSKIYEMMTTENEVQMYSATRIYNYKYDDIHDEVFSISPQYRITAAQEREIREMLESKCEEIFALMGEEKSDEEKIRFFHDYIAENCSYHNIAGMTQEELAELADNTHYSDAYGALVENEAVCEGYARAFKYLCDRSGINSGLVYGQAGGEEHMWNVVKLSGRPYTHIDVTWDDHYDEKTDSGAIIYDYFKVSDEVIGKDHTVDKGLFDYPVCP